MPAELGPISSSIAGHGYSLNESHPTRTGDSPPRHLGHLPPPTHRAHRRYRTLITHGPTCTLRVVQLQYSQYSQYEVHTFNQRKPDGIARLRRWHSVPVRCDALHQHHCTSFSAFSGRSFHQWASFLFRALDARPSVFRSSSIYKSI